MELRATWDGAAEAWGAFARSADHDHLFWAFHLPSFLALLPPGVGMMMWSLNPKYVGSLFHDSMGKVMLIGATGLAIAGFIWMKKMIEIEA